MKKTRNPLSHLGWLGLIGLVGLWASAPLLTAFLLFFFFFMYRSMTPDELFWENVRRAGVRALTVNLTLSCVVSLILFSRALWYVPDVPLRVENGIATMEERLYQQFLLLADSFILIFITTLGTFMLTLMIFHRREKRFAEEGTLC